MSYLDDFWDPNAIVPDDWTVATISAVEIVRLGRLAQVAEVAATLRRRMDGASPSLQAADKRWGRRVAHLARQQGGAWLTELNMVGELDRVEPGKTEDWNDITLMASHITWTKFIPEQAEELRDRCRLVVSWGIMNGHRRFANRASNRYMVEIERMVDALNK